MPELPTTTESAPRTDGPPAGVESRTRRRGGSTHPRAIVLAVLAPVVFWLTHYPASILHELSHSTLACLLGIKSEAPWDLDWGGTGWWNLLLLAHIDENVDYRTALAAGHHVQVAIVAAAGVVIGNLVPYLVVRWLIVRRSLAARPVLTYVLFWYLFCCLANLYDYVPTRVFAADGDVTHVVWATGANRWAIYVLGGYLVAWAIVDFYRRVMPHSLAVARFDGLLTGRAFVLVLATTLLFGYFALPTLLETDPVSQLIGWTSVALIPVVLVVTWRRNVVDPLERPSGRAR